MAKRAKPRFAVCVDNSGYLASLELHKVYRVVPDASSPPPFVRAVRRRRSLTGERTPQRFLNSALGAGGRHCVRR